MTDILLLEARVRNTIQLGESHYREFKSAYQGVPSDRKSGNPKTLCHYIGEALVAFANADGGELLVGVEDNGQITGVPHQESVVQNLLNAPTTHVHRDSQLPMITKIEMELDGKMILFFSVSKGTTEIYQLPDDRCVRRKDTSTVPATFHQIEFDRRKMLSREYDQHFVDGATVADLDLNLLRPIAENYLTGLTPEGYLQQVRLADYAFNGLRLRRAALLLFAKDINRWHPRCQVRILRVIGTELLTGERYNITTDEIVQGNLLTLLRSAWEQLRPHLVRQTSLNGDGRFESHHIYPEIAGREALVNAIAHRAYNIQNGIEVFIFDDRLEIRSPGALLSTITIEDLQSLEGVHESRNVFIARVLNENQYMRELGEGMRRMFALMDEHELPAPQLYTNGSCFSVTLFHKATQS